LTTDLPRTANRLARAVTLAGATVAAVLVAGAYVSTIARGVELWGLVVLELVCLTPFVVAWLGLRFRPESVPLSVAVAGASGLGLFVYADIAYREGASLIGYYGPLIPFVQLGWCLLWIALTWWLGDGPGAARR
jgi:hypothetical protein